MTKLIFFGTQSFGAAMLKALIDSRHYEVVGVITQPDRPIGRHQEVELSPVKKVALDNGITTILQPESLKGFSGLPETDVAVVCQYGLIIPQAILDIPKKGTINIHTSLLPNYRGASPIQAALMHGETETGITIMLMDAKMDHGPIFSQEKITIASDDTYPVLSEKMIPVAQKLLLSTLEGWLAGSVQPQEQNHEAATFCTILSRDDGKVDFSKTAKEIYNTYRGTYPWPGTWAMWSDKRLKLLNIRPTTNDTLAPGKVSVENKKILIGTKQGALDVLELQLEGKKPLTAEQFILGNKQINGVTLS